MTLPTPLTLPTLALALKSALAPKQFGSADILTALVAEVALAVMPTGERGFNVDNVWCIVQFVLSFPSFLSFSLVEWGM